MTRAATRAHPRTPRPCSRAPSVGTVDPLDTLQRWAREYFSAVPVVASARPLIDRFVPANERSAEMRDLLSRVIAHLRVAQREDTLVQALGQGPTTSATVPIASAR